MASAISSLRENKKAPPKWQQRLSHWFRPYEHMTVEEETAGKTPQFRYMANAIEIWGIQILALLAISWFAPHWWTTQLQAGPWALLLTFLAFGFFVTAPFEWFFHRFGLHRLLAFRLFTKLIIVPEDGRSAFTRRLQRTRNSATIGCVYYVAKMTYGHGAHHKITDVTPVNPSRLSEMFNAINKYEITTNGQTDHAVFPHFSVIGFWLFFLPVTLSLQWIANVITAMPGSGIPHLPVVIAGMLSMTWQVWLYENSHAVMHKPYAEWWRPKIQIPIVGKWFSGVYRFHFFHHMNESCSLGVVGAVWFCYFWDRFFGTYKLARLELIDAASKVNGEVLEMSKEEIMVLPNATPDDFSAPGRSSKLICYLDRQSTHAQEMWNGLFVAALKEVRRRAKDVAIVTAPKMPLAANIASGAAVPRHPVKGVRP